MNKAIFLDKDGTLIPDIPYNIDPGKISLSANCMEGLRLLRMADYRLIIVSNQSGIAKGRFSEEQFLTVTARIYELLEEQGILLDGFYYCPHHPEGSVDHYAIPCNCRKPMPGMLLKAAEEYQIDLSQSWMIGDILNDVEAGNRAGCRSILINNGNETEWLRGNYRLAEFICGSINEAAIYISKYNLPNV